MLLQFTLGVGVGSIVLRRAQQVQRMLRSLGHLAHLQPDANPMDAAGTDAVLLAGEALPPALPAQWQLAAVLPREATTLVLVQLLEHAALLESDFPARIATYHPLLQLQWQALHSQHTVHVLPQLLLDGLHSLVAHEYDALLLPQYVLQQMGLPQDGQPMPRLLAPWGCGHQVLLTRIGDHGLTETLQGLHHRPSANALRLEQHLRQALPSDQLGVQLVLAADAIRIAALWADANAVLHHHSLHGPVQAADALMAQMAAQLLAAHSA